MLSNGRLMETFPTKEEAEAAASEWDAGLKVASSLPEIWIIDNFVVEAGLGGMLLGQVHEVDLWQYKLVRELTQREYDAEAEQYFNEFGYYPDQ